MDPTFRGQCSFIGIINTNSKVSGENKTPPWTPTSGNRVGGELSVAFRECSKMNLGIFDSL